MALGPLTLSGRHVRLEPLRPHHAGGLLAAASSPEIWPFMFSDLSVRSVLDAWMEEAAELEAEGAAYPFAVISQTDDRIIGSTRYMDLSQTHRRVEIGWTWYAPEVWGSAVNPECKRLLLGHAFESWHALRVQLKTDHLNLRSQAAIARLGAQSEGVLRNHMVRRDGSLRHTVMFSILPEEWPQVKAGLDERLRAL